MINLVLVAGFALVVLLVYRAIRPEPTKLPAILAKRLSDRDQIVYVEKDGSFWVYSKPEPETNLPMPTETEDCYPNFRWN